MPVKHDRDSDLARARAHLNKLSSNSTDPEALTSFKEYRKLLKRHTFSLADLLSSPDGKPLSIDDFLRGAEKAKEVMAVGKAVLADPEVQKTLTAGVDAVKGIASLLKKVRR